MKTKPATLLTAALLALSLGTAGQSQEPRPRSPLDSEVRLQQVRKLAVMITASFQGETPKIGAGIVFGARRNRLYVATARHVVRTRDDAGELNVTPTRVEVEFSHFPGEVVEARWTDDRRHAADDDLTVLIVTAADTLDLGEADFPFSVLGDVRAMRARDQLYVIGQMEGRRWDMNLRPFLVKSIGSRRVELSGDRLVAGASGGPVFDEQLRLVGMAQETDASLDVMLPVDSAIAHIEAWGYPVNLARWQIADAFGLTGFSEVTLPSDTTLSRFLDPRGLRFRACRDCPETALFCDRFLTRIEQIEDRVVRVYDVSSEQPSLLDELVGTAGATPARLAAAELYTALERAAVQCLMVRHDKMSWLPRR